MQYTILFQRGTIKINLDRANPRLSTQPPAVKHLLKYPQDDTALCGYGKESGDTVEGNYIDRGSVSCTKCTQIANMSDENR